MILADTSVWIDYFNGKINTHTDKLDKLLSTEQVIMGDIILAEILQGFRKDSEYNKAKEALGYLNCYSISNKIIAIKSAENFRYLRKKGITIRKTTDMLIATYCIENKVTLLHNDKDFLPFEILGLQVLL
ncbi:MAG: PIN domain nuclease [Bacteroidetes bacterium]|nr:PIN domain nuclease [Bacteroidota bacterium]MBL6942964.1 PIN domain nuclease [Bacteroidales bacterium]